MRFEVEADIPDGYEPTGELRPPRKGDWYLFEGEAQVARWGHAPESTGWIILRKKSIAYEDFEPRSCVSVTESGGIEIRGAVWNPDYVENICDALRAAADHVDRVNKQKSGTL